MGVNAGFLVKPLVEPHHFDVVGVDRDDEQLGRRLLVQPVEVTMQRV